MYGDRIACHNILRYKFVLIWCLECSFLSCRGESRWFPIYNPYRKSYIKHTTKYTKVTHISSEKQTFMLSQGIVGNKRWLSCCLGSLNTTFYSTWKQGISKSYLYNTVSSIHTTHMIDLACTAESQQLQNWKMLPITPEYFTNIDLNYCYICCVVCDYRARNRLYMTTNQHQRWMRLTLMGRRNGLVWKPQPNVTTLGRCLSWFSRTLS